MLETLRNHFQSYGLTELEFIIVNSKLSHSQERIEELRNRVSFEVFQETNEEEVWSLLEGGKDDMFVYDRCGRLTFYIPFPLSILNESPLVARAVLATYFRSPCGDKCDQNKTIEIEEIVKNLEFYNETEQDNSTLVDTEQPDLFTETNNQTFNSNHLFNILEHTNEEVDANTSLAANITDYEYPDYNDTSFENNSNNTSVVKAKSFFNSIYRIFFTSENNEEVNEFNETSVSNDTFSSDFYQQIIFKNNASHNDDHKNPLKHHKHHHSKEKDNSEFKPKSDRCHEANYEVCKSWSKKRLLHAQMCCSDVHSNAEDRKSCVHFGKKRCKKIQSILKCCIKTVYTEPSVRVLTEEMPTAVSTEDSQIIRPKESEENGAPNIVCCKEIEGSKFCRVSNAGVCEEDEYVEYSASKGK